MLYDVFICHASEDKKSFVKPLAEELRRQNIEVWYDEFSLKMGDSIRRVLDKGLKQSRFGLVVLSNAFFDKEWPQYELDGLTEKEMIGREKVILPIWHNISHDEIMSYSPSLAGKKAALSSDGISNVVNQILEVIHPEGSPLLIARDTLIERGISPPVITDQYWLKVVEASNRMPGFGAVIPEESSWGRWSFPLPPKEGNPQSWGERLAWTSMQLEWVKSAEEIPISPISKPDIVLQFIDEHPGLFETCEAFPMLTIEYAPQLKIPTFGGKLEPVLEKEYKKSLVKYKELRQQKSTQGSALTKNQLCPFCDEEWALRHPNFGDYKPSYIANEYFSGGMFGPEVSPFEHADHLFWLLSEESKWLPVKIRDFLTQGMCEWHAWKWDKYDSDNYGGWRYKGALSDSIYKAQNIKEFKWTKSIKEDVLTRINLSIQTLHLPDSADEIFRRFVEGDFINDRIKREGKKTVKRKIKQKGKIK